VSLAKWRPVTGVSILTGSDFAGIPPYVSHAGSYWFSATPGSGASLSLRYSTSATGPFVEATLPAEPSGYDLYNVVIQKGVVYGDGTYAFLVAYYDAPSTIKYRVLHATDPAGTWSSYEWDSTDDYICYCFAFLDGLFIIGGYYNDGASPYPAFIATCATADGTYTINTSAATTGYDISVPTGSPAFWFVSDIAFDGTNWVSIGLIGGTAGVRTSTTLTSGWSNPGPSVSSPAAFPLQTA
jgi:hypothetical protein